MRLDVLTALNRARAERRAAVVVTDLDTGAQRFVEGEAVACDSAADLLTERLRLGRSGPAEIDGRAAFIAVLTPPVRLVVIGAVHVSQALSTMARVAGLDMVVIDPRTAFASAERFPDCRVMPEWPDVALPRLGLDAFTAVATLTHDPKIDDMALAAALRSPCFYVGALGSRRTHAARLARLTDWGFGTDDLTRIRAPIGIDIGAVTPAEIAVSILGEVILARRRKPLRTDNAATGSAA